VRFWNESFEASAFTTDLSDSGLLVETARRLEPGTRLHVELELGDRAYFTEAVVARRADYPQYAQSVFKPAIGLRFLGLEEALRESEAARQPEESDPETLWVRIDAEPKPADLGEPPTRPDRAGEVAPKADPPPSSLPSWSCAGRPSHAVDLSDRSLLRRLYERDLSKGALMVRTDRLPELGTVLCVALRLPPPHRALAVQGEVVSTFSGKGRVGLLLENWRALAELIRGILDTAG